MALLKLFKYSSYNILISNDAVVIAHAAAMFTPPPSAISSCHSESQGPKRHNDIDRQLTGKVSDLDSFPIEVGKLLLLDIAQYITSTTDPLAAELDTSRDRPMDGWMLLCSRPLSRSGGTVRRKPAADACGIGKQRRVTSLCLFYFAIHSSQSTASRPVGLH